MRTRFFALAISAAAACTSNATQDAGPDTNAPHLNGSCLTQDSNAAPHLHNCVDYAGYVSTAILPIMNGCPAHPQPGVWSSTGCSHQGAFGGCTTMTSMGFQTSWYYTDSIWADEAGLVIDCSVQQAQNDCAAQGGTFVMP
jgi:hypothetical protein